jgi:hypothetical protein
MDRGSLVTQGPPEELYHHQELFHRPDGERAPQVAELLFALENEGLLPPDSFTAREERAVEILTAALRARQGAGVAGR